MIYKKITKPAETKTVTMQTEAIDGYEITYYLFDDTTRKPIMHKEFIDASHRRGNESIKNMLFRWTGLREENTSFSEKECIDKRIKKAILAIAYNNSEIERLTASKVRNEQLIEAIAEGDE